MNLLPVAAICICIFIFTCGCTVSNKYAHITIVDKFTQSTHSLFSLDNKFVVTDTYETIKVGDYCYHDHTPCYDVFSKGNSYDVRFGKDGDDVVITEIIRASE